MDDTVRVELWLRCYWCACIWAVCWCYIGSSAHPSHAYLCWNRQVHYSHTHTHWNTTHIWTHTQTHTRTRTHTTMTVTTKPTSLQLQTTTHKHSYPPTITAHLPPTSTTTHTSSHHIACPAVATHISHSLSCRSCSSHMQHYSLPQCSLAGHNPTMSSPPSSSPSSPYALLYISRSSFECSCAYMLRSVCYWCCFMRFVWHCLHLL